jgi:uncharacterized coiled-coil protein SlyX
MSDSDLLAKIYTLQVEHSARLGTIASDITAFNSRLDRLESNCRICMDHEQKMGEKIAVHEVELTRHNRKLSGLFDKFHEVENTGVHFITEEKVRWSTIKIIGAILIGLVTLGASSMGIIKSCKEITNHESRIQNK